MDFANSSGSVANQSQVTQNDQVGGLQYLATKSPTGRAVFKALSERARFRRTTDLRRLYIYIVDKIDHSTTEEGFLQVFQQLQALGVGKLIIGRKNNPNRFRWNFNLKEVAQAAYDNKPLTDLAALPRKRNGTHQAPVKQKRRRRRRSSTNVVTPSQPAQPVQQPIVAQQPVPQQTAPGITINITLPPTAKPEDVQAFVDLAKGLQGS